jgi:hypothetical protein
MPIPALLLSQLAIAVLVVTLYHVWTSRKKRPEPGPPAVLPPLAAPAAAAAAAEKLAPALPAVVAAVAAPPKAPPAEEGGELLAVIAASLAVVLGRRHRVVSVEPAGAHAPAVNVWALEGRVEQFMSHKIR